MVKAQIYWIPGPWAGRLGIVPRPRGGDWLQDEIKAWGAIGINIVVSLLTTEEVAEFGLEQEGHLCNANGIKFHSFPIPDRGVPESMEVTTKLITELATELVAGKSVVGHCRQSIGRAAMLAAILLATAGEADTFAKIATVRGCHVPDTTEQQNWVEKQFGRQPAKN